MIRWHYWKRATADALKAKFAEPAPLMTVDPGKTGAAVFYDRPAVEEWLELARPIREGSKRAQLPPLYPTSFVPLQAGRGYHAIAEHCRDAGIRQIIIEQPFMPRAAMGKRKGSDASTAVQIGSVSSAMSLAATGGVLLGQVLQACELGTDLDAVWTPAAAWQTILAPELREIDLPADARKRDRLKAAAQLAAGKVVELDAVPKGHWEGLADALGLGSWWGRTVWL